MNEEYVTEEEYPSYFGRLAGLRERIALILPVQKGMRLMDLATGYGFFALAIARQWEDVAITGIDLTESNVRNAKEKAATSGLSSRFSAIKMDATDLRFPERHFDMVINFLGLEDIHMTRGQEGVSQTFREVFRVLEGGGHFCFVAMPPEEAETAAQKTEIEVFSYVCGATWLSAKEYGDMLCQSGFVLERREAFGTGKKLAPSQAQEKIEYACTHVPDLYGITTSSFSEVWGRFGEDIERDGMGHYSRVNLFVARKPDDATMRQKGF